MFCLCRTLTACCRVMVSEELLNLSHGQSSSNALDI